MKHQFLSSRFLIFWVLGVSASIVNSQISAYISTAEINVIKDFSLATLISPQSLSDAYYAAKVLEASNVKGFSCGCSTIGSLLKIASSNIDRYYGITSSKKCGCNIEIPDVSSTALDGLKVSSIC